MYSGDAPRFADAQHGPRSGLMRPTEFAPNLPQRAPNRVVWSAGRHKRVTRICRRADALPDGMTIQSAVVKPLAMPMILKALRPPPLGEPLTAAAFALFVEVEGHAITY